MSPTDLPSWLAARLDTPRRARLHAALEEAGAKRSPSAITAWLKGRGVPEPECVPAIIDVLGLDAEEAADLYNLCKIPLHPALFADTGDAPKAA